jgi:hypothetical protein
MALILSSASVESGETIRAGHVTQSIKALTGTEAYDITISGSLKVIGPTNLTGSVGISNNLNVVGTLTTGELELTNLTVNGIADIATANIDAGIISASFTGSLLGTASYVTGSSIYGPFGSNSILTSSYALTSSYSLNALSASYAPSSPSIPTYRATINQTSNNPPVPLSGFIDTINVRWTYDSFGIYILEATGSITFTNGKTRVLLTNGLGGSPYFLNYQRINDTSIYITSNDINGTGLDDIIQNATIIVEIDY